MIGKSKQGGSGPSPEVALNSSSSHISSETGIPDAGDLITIARIVRPQGIKGEVLADIATDFPDRFAQSTHLFICKQAVKIEELLLEDFWFHQGRIVLKFQGIDTRTQAEELRNSNVQIRSSELMPLPEGSFYEFQLIGCKVSTEAGEDLGLVKELMHTGAAPILVVTAIKGGEHLIPLAEDICTRIDIEAKTITVAPPEGLLDI